MMDALIEAKKQLILAFKESEDQPVRVRKLIDKHVGSLQTDIHKIETILEKKVK